MKKLFTYIFAVATLIFLFVIMPGYRLTPESAAKAHSFLPKTAHLAKEYRTSMGNVFIYRVENYYLTIVPQKVGPLWIARESVSSESINDKSDKVRTIGLYSSGRNGSVGTIMVIDVQDDRVKYIEAGEEKQRIRKSVVPGKYVEFTWDKTFLSDINAVALSEDGKELYRYNYGNIANRTDTSELRWHEALETLQKLE